MGLLAIWASAQRREPVSAQGRQVWELWSLRAVAATGLGLCVFHFFREIRVIPIDYRWSDIVPTVQVMTHRLLDGQYPYALIRDFGYDLSPTYLPLMWLPFLPAALFHFDERWVAFAIWALAAVALVRQAQQRAESSPAKWLVTALPFFYFILIEEATDATYGNTIELMLAGFYMLLALQLTKINAYLSAPAKRSGAILAFFILLCLLSRYSFLLWLPFAALVLWSESKKMAYSTAIWTVAGILALFVLPFLSQDPMIYVNGLKHYSAAALSIWEQTDKTGPLYDGVGVAVMFKEGAAGEMAQRLAALQRWQMALSLAATAFAGIWWWKKRSSVRSLPLFLLGSLKLYFAFFYGFVQAPYVYLMLVPSFFSIAMLLAWYKQDEARQRATASSA
jgi:hypothetical protein